MLDNIKSFKINRATLIGRPRLTLINNKCGNIVCNKIDQFKKVTDELYICECGYRLEGVFEEIKHKTKFGCGTNSCPVKKIKMDSGCLKCPFIIEK